MVTNTVLEEVSSPEGILEPASLMPLQQDSSVGRVGGCRLTPAGGKACCLRSTAACTALVPHSILMELGKGDPSRCPPLWC